MFILYECAVCVVPALIAAMLLFAACVMFLVLKAGVDVFLAPALQKVIDGAIQLKGDRMPAKSHDS